MIIERIFCGNEKLEEVLVPFILFQIDNLDLSSYDEDGVSAIPLIEEESAINEE